MCVSVRERPCDHEDDMKMKQQYWRWIAHIISLQGLVCSVSCKWMACEHGKHDYIHSTFFVLCNHYEAGLLSTLRRLFHYIKSVGGKCVFMIKWGRWYSEMAPRQAVCPVPSSTLLALCQWTRLSYACNLARHLPRASSILTDRRTPS